MSSESIMQFLFGEYIISKEFTRFLWLTIGAVGGFTSGYFFDRIKPFVEKYLMGRKGDGKNLLG